MTPPFTSFLENHPRLSHSLGRASWYFFTFVVAVAVNFFLPRLGDQSPVDTLIARAGENLDTAAAREQEEAYLREFGLVEVDARGAIVRAPDGSPVETPLVAQFVRYLSLSFQGDLGTSILQYPKSVNSIIGGALPWTIALQLPAIVLGWVFGNLLGALAAYRRGIFDKLLYPLALLASAIPAFCVAILLVFVFSIELEWFPAMGGYDDSRVVGFTWDFLASAAHYYVMPFLSIFSITLGSQAIGMRSMCIYELGTDYIRYSKLLGIQEHKILLYTFRNAMLPQLTGLALALGAMVGGALITEMIFSYPGLGMTIMTAIQGNDYPLITGTTLLITVTVLIANFSVDLLVGFLDPRVALGQRGKR